MKSRGLPGFLRRSRRSDFDEDDDDDDDDEEEEEEDEEVEEVREQQVVDSKPASHNAAQTKNDLEDTLPATSINDDNKNNNINGKTDDTNQSLPPHANSESSIENVKNQNLNTRPKNWIESCSSTSSLGSSSASRPARRETAAAATTTTMTTTTTTTTNMEQPPQRKVVNYRESQFEKIIAADVVPMNEMRKLGWNGIPPQHRGMIWKLMLGYLPTNQHRRKQTLERKRAEYKDAIQQHYEIDDNSRTLQEQETLRQVLVDVPRTAPEVPLFRNERIKRCLARLLYIWAMRHPASSYVQGINDLATPLFAVFLSDYYNGEDVLDGNVMVVISDERLEEVEADVYWSLTNVLAGIQDHYTADQPGVQRMVMRLEELVQRIDGALCEHLSSVGIQFMQFAFKWMNCLLLREFNLRCVVRLWDTYLSEDGGFEDFHVYVCAAFLCQFSQQLQEMDFDELFGFMQQVPTENWGETEIEMLLSQAYVLSTLFGGSDAHLASANHNR